MLPQLIQPQESISQRLRTHIQPPGPPGLFWITLICSISKQDTKNRRFRHILGVNPLRFYTRSVPLSWDNNFAAYNVSIRCSVRELFKKRRFPPNRRYRPIAFTNPFALRTFSTRICKGFQTLPLSHLSAHPFRRYLRFSISNPRFWTQFCVAHISLNSHRIRTILDSLDSPEPGLPFGYHGR